MEFPKIFDGCCHWRAERARLITPSVPGLPIDFSFDLMSGELSEEAVNKDDSEEKQNEKVESERHKRLIKLKFDRRPSAALAAWAKEPEEVERETEPDIDESASEATVVDTSEMSEEDAAKAIACHQRELPEGVAILEHAHAGA